MGRGRESDTGGVVVVSRKPLNRRVFERYEGKKLCTALMVVERERNEQRATSKIDNQYGVQQFKTELGSCDSSAYEEKPYR